MAPVDVNVAVSVRFAWQSLGAVTLDDAGKVTFPRPLPAVPGLYRLRFTGGDVERFYIGETDNVRRRLGTNYRSPGPRQRTSLRVNEALATHLAAGGDVSVDAALTAEWSNGDDDLESLDLTRKASRLLAENAALVLAQRAGLRQENLG